MSPMALLESGIPLSLLIDLVMGPESADLLAQEHIDQLRQEHVHQPSRTAAS